MDARTFTVVFVSLIAFAACEKAEPPPPTPAAQPQPAAEPAPARKLVSFVNQVWEVVESPQVEKSALRVFLQGGTLVMASPNSTPAFGSWRYADGRLTIIEEGQSYPTDILELSDRAFRIRMLSPGEPVEILFRPAGSVPPEASAGAGPAQAREEAEPDDAPMPLVGTAWRLESLAGSSVLDRVEATLEFANEGRVSGNGSCNRFNGVVTIERGGKIAFGGLAATRKGCPEPQMKQETAYFAALQAAERYEVEGDILRIFAKGQPEPLRFKTMAAAAPQAANTITRAGPAQDAALAGIWTIRAHHHSPGISAMTDAEARARYGQSIRLTSHAAVAPGNTCREPRYATRQVPVAAYLTSAFNFGPSALPPLAGHNQMRVMEVSCGTADWTELGGTLLEVDRDRALAPWDGVFFELARDRDFRGVGQEPGWQIELRKGLEMRFTYDYGRSTAVTPAPKLLVDPKTGTQTYHAKTEANDLRLEIVPVHCEDSMSGKPYPTTVTVTLNQRTFRGCGEHLATPFQ